MSPSSRKGFTIIELLVAVGVTALLVTLMVSIVTTVLTNWNRTSGTLSTGNQARLVLDQMSQDLQGAIFKIDGNVWLAASIQKTGGDAGTTGENWSNSKKPVDTNSGTDATDDSLNLAPAGLRLEDYRFGQGGAWLRFFAIPSGDPNGTDVTGSISAPRAISYQIVRRRVGGGSSTQFSYQLYRSEVLPYSDNPTKAAASTFTVGYNLYTSADPGYNVGDGATSGLAGNIRRPNVDQVIANGIVDFGVRLFTGTTTTPIEAFPIDRRVSATTIRVAFAATSDTAKSQPAVSGVTVAPADTSYGFPVVAEISIRVLTPEGARLIEALEEDKPVPGTWWEIVEQNSNVYTRRIDLKATAL